MIGCYARTQAVKLAMLWERALCRAMRPIWHSRHQQRSCSDFWLSAPGCILVCRYASPLSWLPRQTYALRASGRRETPNPRPLARRVPSDTRRAPPKTEVPVGLGPWASPVRRRSRDARGEEPTRQTARFAGPRQAPPHGLLLTTPVLQSGRLRRHARRADSESHSGESV